MQPFLEEINLNNDWIKAPNKVSGEYIQRSPPWIDLISSVRNPDDIETKPINAICTNVNDTSMTSTYTGVMPTKVFKKYKVASSFLGWFKETHNAKIARVNYVKLPSQSSIAVHIDGGLYFQKHDRFHLILQGEYQYTVNGEMQEYKEGELWWFNNQELHETYNHGSKDRITMIFDCKCDMERIINDPR